MGSPRIVENSCGSRGRVDFKGQQRLHERRDDKVVDQSVETTLKPFRRLRSGYRNVVEAARAPPVAADYKGVDERAIAGR